MTAFVDTNVLVYAHTATAYAEPCRRLLVAVARGELDATTNVLVAEEAWHVERRAPLGIPPGTMLTMLGLFDRVLGLDIDIVERAMRSIDVPDSLSSADRIHVATCRSHGIDVIISADSAFDGVVGLRRVDPTDSAVADLLGEK